MLSIISAADWVRPATEAGTTALADARGILDDIRANGTAAIRAHSLRLDGFEPASVDLKPFESYDLDRETTDAIRLAHARIRRFAEMQRETVQDREFADETGRYGQRVVPVRSVAAYVPGGRHPLVSTALMTLVPAEVAGVETRVAVSPSTHPAVLAACSLAGATAFVHLGGAQAIGAMAFGSDLHPAVDMIVGPGNAWVNAAKSLVQGTVGIDTLAGPSEVLVIAGPTDDPEWLAWDLLAQAEHDPLAFSVLASWDRTLLDAVAARLGAMTEADEVLARDGIHLVLADSPEATVAFSNAMGPEHLHVHTEAVEADALTSYGSLFLGPESAVALGDYISGPNHTLPTSGYAAVKGGLSVLDFLRVLTWQEVTPEGLSRLGPAAARLADEEGLRAHAQSLRVRMR